MKLSLVSAENHVALDITTKLRAVGRKKLINRMNEARLNNAEKIFARLEITEDVNREENN